MGSSQPPSLLQEVDYPQFLEKNYIFIKERVNLPSTLRKPNLQLISKLNNYY